jgi:hypothetical protein
MQTVIGDCQSLQWDAAVRGPRGVERFFRFRNCGEEVISRFDAKREAGQ